jgi:hypothetical protein
MTICSGLRWPAAAYEVDDFEAVAVFQQGFGPAVAGDDGAVEFDGDAVGLHGEGFDQGCEGEWGGRRGVWEGAGFVVDVEVHGTRDAA